MRWLPCAYGRDRHLAGSSWRRSPRVQPPSHGSPRGRRVRQRSRISKRKRQPSSELVDPKSKSFPIEPNCRHSSNKWTLVAATATSLVRPAMFRTPVFTAVDVVMREQDALAGCPHVAEMMSEYLDASPKWTIERAACAGYMTLLDRLGKRELPISPRELDWALRTAADRGDLRIVQWLTAYRPDMECSTRVMDSAALRGHLHVIKWLHYYRDEGCTTAAMDSAAAYGRLDVVQWLHKNRYEGCTTAAMDSAAAGGHLKTVQWLAANRSEGFTTVASNFALLNGHIEILRWLNEQRAKQLGEEQADEYAGAVKSSTRWIRRERRLSATVLEAPQRRPRRMSMNVLGRNRE